jgi:hypothetical protein
MMLLVSSCGRPKVGAQEKSAIAFEIEYSKDLDAWLVKSTQLEIANPAYMDGRVTFTYRNTVDALFTKEPLRHGLIIWVKVTTFTGDNIEVDTIEQPLVPGEVSLPCSGKIVSVLTDAKGQKIARVKLEHLCKHSIELYTEYLKKLNENR